MTEIGAGLAAAFRLARGWPDGMDRLPPQDPPRLAVRSFLALGLCAALEPLQSWLGGPMDATGLSRVTFHSLARDVMVTVVSWLAFAVISHRVAVKTGHAGLWPRYIAAWNWCNLLQSLMLAAALGASRLGLPDLLSQTVILVILGWMTWLGYFIARVGLGFGVWLGVAMVALDYAVSQLTQGLMDRLG